MDKKTEELILTHDIISFDVYDTLINRDVNHYNEVFNIVENTAVKLYGDDFSGFANKRVEAEKRARNRYNREITIDEIYDELEFQQKEIIKEIEVNTEIEISTVNLGAFPIFEFCVSKRKRIIIVSDMYLSKNTIETILTKNNIYGYSDVFVSSEYGVTKRTGLLFDRVVDELNVNPKSILHIGDNVRSDYFVAKIKKLSTIRINEKKHTRFLDKHNVFYSFVNNRISLIQDEMERIGFEVYGPFIFGFLSWCNSEFTKKGINNLFFASRDSFILKEAFEVLYPNYQLHYMKVSRRAVQVPIIGINHTEFDEFLKLASFDPISSTTSIYKRLGLVNYPEENRNIYQADILQFCREDKYIQANKEYILKNAEEERIALLDYLDSINFKGDVGFIDVGWKCSTQQALSQISNANIYGLYCGIHPEAAESVIGKGYLFNSEYTDNFYSIMGGMSLLEAFFTSTEYSLKRYRKVNGAVDFEYDVPDCNTDNDSLLKLHAGALHFIKLIRESCLIDGLKEDPNSAFGILKRIIEAPKKNEIEAFGNIKMENEGEFKSILPFGKYKSIYNIVILYGKSGWKIGYLKQLCKIKLPYNALFRFSYKVFKKL